MEEVKKVSNNDPNKDEYDKRWNENRNMTFRQRKQRDEMQNMQEELNKFNEPILSPFVVSTRDDELELCPISVEHKEGWKAISILIDSGASDSVAPPGTFPDVKTLETNASKAGVQYTAAGGHKIHNLGMQRPFIFLQDGSRHIMSFQVAGVSKALGAVSRLVGAGNRVVFDDPSTVGSFIENKTTGKKTPLRQHNGVYYLDVWVKPGCGYDNQDFIRQAP